MTNKTKKQICECGHSNYEHSATLTNLLEDFNFPCRKCDCRDFKLKKVIK